jgi:hypothetical protein
MACRYQAARASESSNLMQRAPGVEDEKSAVRPLSPEGMAMACRYQAARASESSNLMQHCIFGRFCGSVGTDSPEFMGSIRT